MRRDVTKKITLAFLGVFATLTMATILIAFPADVPETEFSNGALFVGNLVTPAPRTGNGVLRFNAATGEFIDTFVGEGTGPAANPMTGPCCMIFGPDENLYVGNLWGTTAESRGIFRYNGITGQFMDVFVPGGSGGLLRPLSMVFGPDGNLYVADVGLLSKGGQAVRRYDGKTGAFIDVFVTPGSGGLNGPQFFTFGPDGNLYLASSATSSVLRYNGSTGAFIDEFVHSGSGGLNSASGLVFGPDGNLYVSSPSSNLVSRFDGSTGSYIDTFVPAGSGGLESPVGITFGPDGHLYVAGATQNGTGRVLRYDGVTGDFLDTFIPPGTGPISGPRQILFKMKMTICHHPAGLLSKARTIEIGALSTVDHAKHGDTPGACE